MIIIIIVIIFVVDAVVVVVVLRLKIVLQFLMSCISIFTLLL